MSVINKIKEKLLGDDYDNHSYFRLYECNYCNFEVLDSGKWYKVDVFHPYPELYEDEDIPEGIIERVDGTIASDESWNGWQVPKDEYVKHYEDLLRAEFDDVRFLGTDYVPGAVY
ncbi:MAG: hypothetical protein Q4C36_08820 [Coriobacteriia bacterium]|nr:hypothetical protein [Coriobacteriia bacterium]